MVQYLKDIIVHSLDESLFSSDILPNSTMLPPTNIAESNLNFSCKLSQDSNHIALIKQLHSKNHTATCFKYCHNTFTKKACQFGMPRKLIDKLKVDKMGIIHLSHNYAWVNLWNQAIANYICLNHDILWIPTMSKSLLLLYYITNYMTKDDISPWQMVAKAALLKQSINYAKAT
jgi:hypothetical protein